MANHTNSHSGQTEPKLFEFFRFFTLWGIALVCIVLAIFRKDFPAIDQQSTILLGIAVVAVVIDQVTRFEFAGVKVEKLAKALGEMDEAVNALEKDKKPATPKKTKPTADLIPDEDDNTWNSDPNRGNFGGKYEDRGRKLDVTIRPMAGPRSAKCRVTFTVTSTDLTRPLQGVVKVYLHPTYEEYAQYDLKVKGGKVQDDFDAWGVFTIGIVADNGETKLERFLGDVAGGTKKFYEQ